VTFQAFVASNKLRETAVALCNSRLAPTELRFSSSPTLDALIKSGTSRIYADTADRQEIADLLEERNGELYREVDGNTVNQPLVHRVIAHYLSNDEFHKRVKQIRRKDLHLSTAEFALVLYTIICGRIANDWLRSFAKGRPWEISLQLHMKLTGDREAGKRVARLLRAMIPTAIVKVPFAPHAPNCLLVARDLENEGIPVDFTATFSARQAVAAALLSNVARASIFTGRLNQGLRAQLLGEHVTLAAQRAIHHERNVGATKTQLIVASVQDWRTLVNTAGCDIFIAPCAVLEDLISRAKIDPDEIRSQVDTSYADRLGIASEVRARLGEERIGRLFVIEHEFVEFLHEFRQSGQFARTRDSEELIQHFRRAGFGDFFYTPDETEWKAIRSNELPDLDGPLVRKCSLDTQYSLLADGDFQNHQDEMDAEIVERIAG
jgi:transaldolase